MTPEQILVEHLVFNGKALDITGYLVCEREHCAIYSSKVSMNRSDGVWLGNSGISIEKLKAHNRKVVCVSGVFQFRGKSGVGHFNLWLAELRQVTKLEGVGESRETP